MKNRNFLFLLLSGFLVLQSCANKGANRTEASDTTNMQSQTSDTPNANPADTTSNDANEFAMKAASGGMMEVELGNIAQQNAKSARVKSFGAMMVKDHSKANDELKAIAAKKNIMLPTSLSPEHQKHVDDLRKQTGSDFDKHYMEMMTKDHKDDIDEFEDAAKDVKDTDLKAFAAKTLPVLRVHLDSAKAIEKSLKR